MNKRCVLLIIDGLGVGEMDDVWRYRPQDRDAHTLKHVLSEDRNHSSFYYSSGIVSYYCHGQFVPRQISGWNIVLGKSKLAHNGADSFLGHQEIVGSKPPIPLRQFVRHLSPLLIHNLQKAGYYSRFNGKYIVVNNSIAIADNLETDYGLNINVVGSLDLHEFSEIESVGIIVRKLSKVNRVIVMGGTGIYSQTLADCFEKKSRDGFTAWGINIPKLGIYTDTYRVVHLGFDINRKTQVTTVLVNQRIPLTLIGKAADIIRATGAIYKPMVRTELILDQMMNVIKKGPHGCIIANIQETDLSGHAQNKVKYRHHLWLIEQAIPQILSRLNPNDMFLITGDHGNDPTIGHANHTREMTPVIVFTQNHPSADIGTRSTLADIGATIAEFFHIPQTTSGIPVLHSKE